VFGLRSWRVGSLFGIPLEINISWLLVFILVAAQLALITFPGLVPSAPLAADIAAGIVTALMFFASVVAHEFSHSLVARAQGARIARITLFIFGGVSEMEEEPGGPGREFVMAIAGPGMSILLAAVLFLADGALTAAQAPALLVAAVGYLALINLFVGVFNLLPGFPMDGGRVLRSILWAATRDLLRATRWASWTGEAIGYLMIGGGVFGALRGNGSLVWFVFLGWFLASLAGSSYQQQLIKTRLASVTVGSIMSSPVAMAPGDVDLETMVDRYFIGGHHSRYPVEEAGQLVGMLSLAQAKAVPRDRWRATRAADVAERDLGRFVVADSEPVSDVLERIAGQQGAVLAVRDGEVVGIATRKDVMRSLQGGAGS
jgi:Zn-dependent protease/predicted transcriptional regulator